MNEQKRLDVSCSDIYDGCESVCLYYNKEDNVFVDEDGYIICNLFELIAPNDLYLFRKHQTYMVVRHRTLPGFICELYCPSIEDENYYFRDPYHDYC